MGSGDQDMDILGNIIQPPQNLINPGEGREGGRKDGRREERRERRRKKSTACCACVETLRPLLCAGHMTDPTMPLIYLTNIHGAPGNVLGTIGETKINNRWGMASRCLQSSREVKV